MTDQKLEYDCETEDPSILGFSVQRFVRQPSYAGYAANCACCSIDKFHINTYSSAAMSGLLRMIIMLQIRIQDTIHPTTTVLGTEMVSADQVGKSFRISE